MVPTFNADADKRLLERFRSSDFTTIGALVGDKDSEVPQHNGNPVCLTWALKGACSSTCKRAYQHQHYPRATLQKLHAFLDKCGVKNTQP